MAETIKGINVVIGAETSGLAKALSDVNKKSRDIQSELKQVDKLLKLDPTNTELLAQKQQLLGNAIESTREKLARLKSVQEQINEQFAKGEISEGQYRAYQREVEATEGRLNSLSKQLNKTGVDLEKVGETLQNAGKKMESAGKGLTAGVTAPIVAVGGLATKTAVDFETAFAGVRKTVDATEAEFKALETGIRDMAKSMPASATEIASVAEAAGQLGIQKANILGFTRTMIDLGVSTNMSSEEAATSLARLANITQMPQTEFGKLGSTIVALGNNLATTESEITAMALRLAGAGTQVGLSEAQILSFAGALSSVGIEAEAGGSAFSKVMIDISKAVQTGSKDLNLFASVAGMSATQFQTAFRQDAAGAILTFVEGLGKMSKSGQNTFGVLDQLGLSEIRVRDALLRASNAGDTFREAIELGNVAWKENTALNNEAQQRYNTTASKMQMLKNRLNDVGITLGQALIPALLDTIKALEPLFKSIESSAKWFAALDTGSQRAILSVLGFAAALGPTLIAAGKLVTAVGSITKAVGALKTSVTVASTTTVAAGGAVSKAGALFAGITGPVGIAIAAITALIAAGVALYKYFSKDSIAPVQRYGDEASAAAQRASGSFKQFRNETTGALKDTAATAKTAGKEIGSNIASGVGGGTKEAKQQAVGDMQEMIERMKETVSKGQDELNKLGEAIVASLKKRYEAQEDAAISVKEVEIKEAEKASGARIKEFERQQKAAETAADNEIKLQRELTNAKIKELDREYAAKLQSLDAETAGQVKAVQDQIDAIDAQAEAEEKARKEQEYQAKLTELQKSLAATTAADERAKIEGEITKLVADHQQAQVEESRKAEKERLRSQIDAIKDAATAKRDALKAELDEKKTNEQDMLQALVDRLTNEKNETAEHIKAQVEAEKEMAAAVKERLDGEKQAIKTHYDDLTSSEALQAEARKLVLGKKETEILALLKTYNPKWQEQGKNFADSLAKGIQTADMASAIKSAINIAPTIGGQVKALSDMEKKLKDLQKAAKDAGTAAGGVSLPDVSASTASVEDLTASLTTGLQPGIEGVGEAAEQMKDDALKAFFGLRDQATVALNELKWSGVSVTEETASNIADRFYAMGNTITENLGQSHAEQLSKMAEFFRNSSTLTEEEKNAALKKLQEAQKAESDEVEKGKKRVAEILSTAMDEHRGITQAEYDEIRRIQDTMTDAAERALTEHGAASSKIWQGMQEDAANISVAQAADVVKAANKQRDDAVAAAEDQYKQITAEIRRQRDEVGSISKEQADKLLVEAGRQRDDAIKAAEDARSGVVEQAKNQASEHIEKVNWETGEIKTRWQVFKSEMSSAWKGMWDDAKRNVDNMVFDVSQGYEELKHNIKTKLSEAYKTLEGWQTDVDNFFIRIVDKMKGFGGDIVQGLIDGLKGMMPSLSGITSTIANSLPAGIRNALDMHSPSRVMRKLGQFAGEGLELGLEDSVRSVSTQARALAAAATPDIGSSGFGGAGGSSVSINNRGLLEGAVFNVRTDQDIPAIARELARYTAYQGRGS